MVRSKLLVGKGLSNTYFSTVQIRVGKGFVVLLEQAKKDDILFDIQIFLVNNQVQFDSVAEYKGGQAFTEQRICRLETYGGCLTPFLRMFTN